MRLNHVCAGAALLAITACGGGGGGTTNPNPNPTPTQTLSTIRVSSSTLALAAGAVGTLSVDALDASGRVIAGVTGYSYTSSAATVVEPQSSGELLGISAGTATITVSLTRDGVTATATATVTVTGSLPVAASVAAGASDQTYTPATIVVARNANVTYTFGGLNHTVTFRSVAGAPASVPATTNSSVARAFPVVGDFRYDCTIHSGMSGIVIVR